MVEAMRKRTLLVIATLAWVAPLSAHGPAVAGQNPIMAIHDCPVARAKAVAAARQSAGSIGARAIAPRIQGPRDGSIFALRGSSSVLVP
jgi:hypothetical protein